MKLITAALAAAALSCAFTSHAAVKSSKEDSPTIVLKRGSTPIASFATIEECRPVKLALTKSDGVLKESGSGVYDCIYTERTRVAFGPNPPPPPTCTVPRPTVEGRSMQCPPNSVGTWTQTREYVEAAYPTCWTPAEWTPTSAPPGICASPAPATLLVYACPEAGADGRILESSTVVWPNCVGAGYQAPSKSLVVAVNTGTLPHYWRLASKLTDERIWTQTGTVGAWVRASAIDWGTVTPPAAGTARLRWPPSTENSDDTPLTNLAAYRIVYGTSYAAGTDDMHPEAHTIDVGAGVTSYVIERLPPATYYFSVRALNSKGEKSWPSPVLPKAIP